MGDFQTDLFEMIKTQDKMMELIIKNTREQHKAIQSLTWQVSFIIGVLAVLFVVVVLNTVK